MSDIQKEVSSLFAGINAFFNQPHIQEFYRREAAENAAKQRKIDAAEKAKRERIEAKAKADRAYDAYVVGGGPDECHQFGSRHGCEPHCPVFQRGDCETQAELEAVFATHPSDEGGRDA